MGTEIYNPTFRLTPRGSFLDGVARLLDFGGGMRIYNLSLSRQEADRLALQSDAVAVGNDMREAMANYEQA